MSLQLFSHPFSSYCQKVLVALWENEIPFTYRHLEDAGAAAERASLWPLGKFPVLVDGEQTVVESSIIIEHLDLHYGGPVRLVPEDRRAALEVRFMDRFFDNYVMDAMSKPVFEALKGEAGRKEQAMAEARQALDTAYGWLESRLQHRTWAAGETFTMATAQQLLRSSTPTGCTGSRRSSCGFATIARSSSRGRPLPGRWRRGDPIGLTFRSAPLTATDLRALAAAAWCRVSDSNRRPTAYKAVALPAELTRRGPTKCFKALRTSSPRCARFPGRGRQDRRRAARLSQAPASPPR